MVFADTLLTGPSKNVRISDMTQRKYLTLRNLMFAGWFVAFALIVLSLVYGMIVLFALGAIVGVAAERTDKYLSTRHPDTRPVKTNETAVTGETQDADGVAVKVVSDPNE